MDGDLRLPEPPRRGEAFRQRMLGRIPGWYSPWGHLAATVGIGLATLVVAASRVTDPGALELVAIPVTFLFANVVEWFAHRYLMHQRRFPLVVLYDRHTPEHHRVYRYQSMALRSARELRLVLIPAAGVLGMVLLAAPVALLVGLAISWNVGWLFLATVGTYVLGYELSHLAYHLPETSPVYRLPVLRTLREHHARHHIPRLMQTNNFNVTIPIGDVIFGTYASVADVERALALERRANDGAEPFQN
jgi:hypothetical protein